MHDSHAPVNVVQRLSRRRPACFPRVLVALLRKLLSSPRPRSLEQGAESHDNDTFQQTMYPRYLLPGRCVS